MIYLIIKLDNIREIALQIIKNKIASSCSKST